ncbi:MAG: hypothetical protein KIS77_11265 [Saprospiraceae bacterium]|nr:hypothetical protein [Saprospiraceae bacterium]
MNKLIGAYYPNKVRLMGFNNNDGGDWMPDPGLKYVMIIIEVSNLNDSFYFSIINDVIFSKSGEKFTPIAFASGVFGGIETFIWVEEFGFKFDNAPIGFFYSILYAVPSDCKISEGYFTNIGRININTIKSLPKYDPNKNFSGRFQNNMTIGHQSIPFSNKINKLDNVYYDTLPSQLGIINRFFYDDYVLFNIRVANETNIENIELDSSTVFGTLEDGMTILPEGIILRLTMPKYDLDGDYLIGKILLSSLSLSIPSGEEVMVQKLKDYSGPLSYCKKDEAKLVFAFPKKIFDHLEYLFIENGKFQVSQKGRTTVKQWGVANIFNKLFKK